MKERKVAAAEPDAADVAQERRLAEQLRLFRCSDADGTLQVRTRGSGCRKSERGRGDQ